MSEEEGGTKLRKMKHTQQQSHQQMYQQPPTFQQQMPQQMQNPQEVRRESPEQLFAQSQVPQNVRGKQVEIPPPPPPAAPVQEKSKSRFGSSSGSGNALLVGVLFCVLNSKIIWRQIIKLPFMGNVEPSIIALIINSIIAAIAYYVITTFVMK